MDAQYTPERHLIQLTQDWIGSILIIGAILFPVLEFMDYFVSPQNFQRFMVYRLAISAILVAFYYLNRLKRSLPYQYLIAAASTSLCAATIELAVLQSGGPDSPYYAAMLILVICCTGFVPFNMPVTFSLVSIIYGIYVLPILLTSPATSGVFVSNNAFLFSTAVIGLLLRYHNQKLIVSELRLRAELSEDKRTLEQYSTRLEGLVQEKTGELGVSEAKYHALFENATDGVALLDRRGRIMDVNARFCEMHGLEREAVLGTPYRLLEVDGREGETSARLGRVLAGETLVYEARHFRGDGATVSLEVSAKAFDVGSVPHIQLFHRDITEKKKLQGQLLQSQKMESMGVLAGGIAHDFNNIVTAILGHAEVLRRRVKDDEFAQNRIKTIEEAGRRAGYMVSRLLSFARKEDFELSPTDLNAVVKDTVELLERTLMERSIRPVMQLDPRLPSVLGDGIHLEQVITNLVVNSIDAMPAGGSITFATSVSELGPEASQLHPLLTPGSYAVLIVSDTGSGIPRKVIDRIFDPFFTTKPAGKGTGLGLAMVYGIVKSHKGEIRVESREGEGTSFSLYFPALSAPATPGARKQHEAPPSAAAGGGAGILVVDDDKGALSLAKEALEPAGFRVIGTDSPAYAQDLFSQISDTIDLVIIDIMIPHVSGADLVRHFREIRPGVKVIGMAGFDVSALAGETAGIDRFVRKPLDGPNLLASVREVLSSKKA